MDSNPVTLAKALADPSRLCILAALGTGSELTCGELVERCKVGQSTVSHHLKTLGECGLVSVRQAGQRSLYRLRAAVLRDFAESLAELAGPAPRRRAAVVPSLVDPARGLPDLGSGIVD
jgi:ArsR family transcriptional regulator